MPEAISLFSILPHLSTTTPPAVATQYLLLQSIRTTELPVLTAGDSAKHWDTSVSKTARVFARITLRV